MNTSNKKTVCVIGAGGSGLVAAKCMLEKGLVPMIFDKNSQPCGLWASNESRQTAVWNGLYANISYFTMSFSDHPYPPKTSIIPSLNEVKQYLLSYIEKFQLNECLKLNTAILNVSPTNDEKWLVKTQNNLTNETNSELFDYLVVASGLHSKPRMPKFDGIENYKGLLMHSSEFKLNDERLKNKKVLILGGSYSASDICANLVGHAKQIVNLIQRPYLIAPRLVRLKVDETSYNVKPVDFCMFTRAAMYNGAVTDDEKIQKNLEFLPKIYEYQLKNKNINEALKLDVASEVAPRFSISDFYIGHLVDGKIEPKKGTIRKFDTNGVWLDNGEFEECDVVIYCTGFHVNTSFFDDKILKILNYDPNHYKAPYCLYKFTFHPELKNLALILQYDGIYFAGAELQSIWASLVFTGEKSLPPEETMYADIDKQLKARSVNLRRQYPYPHMIIIRVLASELGLEPDFDAIKQSDPELYRMLWNNLSISAHFFLNDPLKRESSLKLIKEVDYLATKIYKFNDNSNENFNQRVCGTAKEFLKENDNYSVPEYFLIQND